MNIHTASLVRFLGIERPRLQILGQLLWGDPDIVQRPVIDFHRAHVLTCGLLVYRYATSEQAVWVLGEINKLPLESEEGREEILLTVLNKRFVSFRESVWDLRENRTIEAAEFNHPVWESHALDVRAAVMLAWRSRDQQSAGEVHACAPQETAKSPGAQSAETGRTA